MTKSSNGVLFFWLYHLSPCAFLQRIVSVYLRRYWLILWLQKPCQVLPISLQGRFRSPPISILAAPAPPPPPQVEARRVLIFWLVPVFSFLLDLWLFCFLCILALKRLSCPVVCRVDNIRNPVAVCIMHHVHNPCQDFGTKRTLEAVTQFDFLAFGVSDLVGYSDTANPLVAACDHAVGFLRLCDFLIDEKIPTHDKAVRD